LSTVSERLLINLLEENRKNFCTVRCINIGIGLPFYRVIFLTGTKRNQCSSSVFSRISVYFLKQIVLTLTFFLAMTINDLKIG
jgi:hypothetical protein